MRYYPAFLNLENRIAVVVGGGPVAERKTLSLIETGANVVVISPELTVALHTLVKNRQIHHISRLFRKGDLKGAILAVAATDSPETNREISLEGDSLSIFVNNVTSPERSTFIVPALLSRGDLQIAVSTGGQSPSLAGNLKEKLEGIFGPEYEDFLGLIGQARKYFLKNGFPEKERTALLNKLAESDILALLKNGEKEDAVQKARDISGIDKLNLGN